MGPSAVAGQVFMVTGGATSIGAALATCAALTGAIVTAHHGSSL